MTMLSDDELLAALGVEAEEKKPDRTHSAEEERVMAGFDDITRFYEQSGHIPRHNRQGDIFERLYAVRLDSLRKSEQWRQFLTPFDSHGLLRAEIETESPVSDDAALLAELGVAQTPEEDSIEVLRHVRPIAQRKQPNEIAGREVAEDFARFKPLFAAVRQELAAGTRQTRRFGNHAEIKQGELFILNGQMVYIAEVGASFKVSNGGYDARLRAIYDNGTESAILLRSLQRALYKDETGRRISEPEAGPLFSANVEEDDLESGMIYVLRSKSDYPLIAQNRALIHKIGVTGGKVETRIANAKFDPTYLMDEVEVVATYQLFNIKRAKLEKLLHRVFNKARFDITIEDRFGHPVHPKEWFLVPLDVINDVVEKIKDGTLPLYEYEPADGQLRSIY